MDAIAQTQSIRKLLTRAWVPFFTRFGRLTEVQRLTIPLIMDGRNVIVSSPTASGKTESVVAPVAERVALIPGRDGLAMIYVVPTRALANDTLARISDPLESIGIKTCLKHGDKPALPKAIPACLITTPESLDSLICRRPEIFAPLRAVILDEIHLVDNTYRGDQLRVLMKRLRGITGANGFNLHILSATLGKPVEVAERYGSDFVNVSVPGQREIQAEFFKSFEDLNRRVRQKRYKKILCFANSRKRVEALCGELQPLWKPYPVVAHHGSLGREVREHAEEVMKTADSAVCVSTSTLEIGIDIGNVDLVVLADPPHSMSSLHQRLGRGNRRKQVIEAACVVGTPEEESTLEAMFEIARTGAIAEEEYAPDHSVIIQQMFSCLFAARAGLPEPELCETVSDLGDAGLCREILSNLAQLGWVEKQGARWYAATQVMDLGQRGQIHSNIPDQQERTVVDIATGVKIGTIFGLPDSLFLLSGRAWQIVSIDRSRISVKHFRGKASSASFSPRIQCGAFTNLLPKKLQQGQQP